MRTLPILYLAALSFALAASRPAAGQPREAARDAPRLTLRGHPEYVTALAFSPDGKTLASGSQDGSIRLWDPATGEARAVLKSKWVLALACSPDGKTLASGHSDRRGRLWDMAAGREVGKPLQHP